jgi:hypothetical protein
MMTVGQQFQLVIAMVAAIGQQLWWCHGATGDTGYFGVSQISINPRTSVLLSGYAGRSDEASQVQLTITAQAAAFGDGDQTSLMLAVDACGLPSDVVESVTGAINASHGIPRERINISCTHSHSCPHVAGYAPNVVNPTPLEAQHIAQYTQHLKDRLTQVAGDALDSRTPGHEISWGVGAAEFGQNRRGRPIAPNDHDLPVMQVIDSTGATRAIITSYATHATTLAAGDNVVSGDWPGYAREAIQRLYPGSVALVMIGAGADSDPSPRQGSESVSYAKQHGQAIADEVQRLIAQNQLKPASFNIAAAHTEVELSFATQLAPGDPGTARLAPQSGSLSYGVTSWLFGDDLAMTFFEGELVVDYSLRLKSTYDDGRLWINGYSNEVQGYIPSERILYEGGYEADDSTYWYGLPGRFAHGVEDLVIGAVQSQLDGFFNPTDRLHLTINPVTGEVSIGNPTNGPITFDAYTISSEAEQFVADQRWQSLQKQGVAEWNEANNAGPMRLTELNPTAATEISGSKSFTLGRPFLPTTPEAFGDGILPSEIKFEYSVPRDGVKKGIVDFVGAVNTLVLTIDPLTGETAIQNQSPYFDAAIAGYTIASASGRLQPTAGKWNSLQDQDENGWDEAGNVDKFRLTEFNPSDDAFLGSNGRVLHLGNAVNAGGEPLNADDFTFQFLTSDGKTMDGIVVLGTMPLETIAGDYTGDGRVDGNDFLAWQRQAGLAATPPGSGADGNRNGVVDASDLAVWRSNFGAIAGNAAGSNAAVPEPSALVIAATAVAGCLTTGRRRITGFNGGGPESLAI